MIFMMCYFSWRVVTSTDDDDNDDDDDDDNDDDDDDDVMMFALYYTCWFTIYNPITNIYLSTYLVHTSSHIYYTSVVIVTLPLSSNNK